MTPFEREQAETLKLIDRLAKRDSVEVLLEALRKTPPPGARVPPPR